jgi:CRP-like cAMP-binding protein
MSSLLVRKLEHFVQLSDAERARLDELARQHPSELRPGEDLIREGDPPGPINLVLDGVACRYKTLHNGRRQIVGFVVPGDICDSRVFVLRRMDHSIGALTALSYARIETDDILALSDASPRVTRAFWWNDLVEESIAREWLLNIGQRSAYERMAHLLCEIYVRLSLVGMAQNGDCALPLTQTELADALGISAVHTNRTLQTLRSEGLIVLQRGRLQIPDPRRLMAAGSFDPDYLHLDNDVQDAVGTRSAVGRELVSRPAAP